jgi:hypothetical protein
MRTCVWMAVATAGASLALAGCGGDTRTVTKLVTVAGPTVTAAPTEAVAERAKGRADTALARQAERLAAARVGNGKRWQGALFDGYEVGPRKVCVERTPRDQVRLDAEQRRVTHVIVSFPGRRVGGAQYGPC